MVSADQSARGLRPATWSTPAVHIGVSLRSWRGPSVQSEAGARGVPDAGARVRNRGKRQWFRQRSSYPTGSGECR